MSHATVHDPNVTIRRKLRASAHKLCRAAQKMRLALPVLRPRVGRWLNDPGGKTLGSSPKDQRAGDMRRLRFCRGNIARHVLSYVFSPVPVNRQGADRRRRASPSGAFAFHPVGDRPPYLLVSEPA